MFFEKIKTEGLAHLSYIVGSSGEAAVIDPRRDCNIYIETARAQGLEITHIFETHRNEDLISGAAVLAELTGASVYHGPNAAGDVAYAEVAHDGDQFDIGQLRFTVLETPGHTDDHLAFALYDKQFPDSAVGVFTGDALFIGDVGRTDFYPTRAHEVSGNLFDSLHKLLELGDQAVCWPAHGAGSVCGAGMAAREISTLGHEQHNNPMLQIDDRDDFIEKKLRETHYRPPYFELMERYNLEGGPAAPPVAKPRNLTLKQLRQQQPDHIIDVREPTAFATAHLPGSFCIPVAMITSFAGWFLSETDSIGLVGSSADDLEKARIHLMRIGFDNVVGGYTGIIPAIAGGSEFNQLPMIDTQEVASRLESADTGWQLLDVRSKDEVSNGMIEQAEHIYAGHLLEQSHDLDKACSYTVMCGSGMRATVAASWLKLQGFKNVDVYIGSMGAWKSRQKTQE